MGRGVSTVGHELLWGGVGAISQIHLGVPCSVDVLVGLAAELVEVAACLRVEQYKHEGNEDYLEGEAHLLLCHEYILLCWLLINIRRNLPTEPSSPPPLTIDTPPAHLSAPKNLAPHFSPSAQKNSILLLSALIINSILI